MPTRNAWIKSATINSLFNDYTTRGVSCLDHINRSGCIPSFTFFLFIWVAQSRWIESLPTFSRESILGGTLKEIFIFENKINRKKKLVNAIWPLAGALRGHEAKHGATRAKISFQIGWEATPYGPEARKKTKKKRERERETAVSRLPPFSSRHADDYFYRRTSHRPSFHVFPFFKSEIFSPCLSNLLFCADLSICLR